MAKNIFYPQRKTRSKLTKFIILALAAPVFIPAEAASKDRYSGKGVYSQLVDELSTPSLEEVDEQKIRTSLYNLKYRKYIKIVKTKNNNEWKIELTKKGTQLLKGYEFSDLKIEQPHKWDGKWRFVMFDIPEKSRYARDVLRDKLQKMNFFRVQQSVWVCPYPCKKEIEFICEFLGISQTTLVFTGEVNRDYELKKHFRKLGFSL